MFPQTMENKNKHINYLQSTIILGEKIYITQHDLQDGKATKKNIK